ncbi:phosphoglycerate dehydrogenase-like oxidoreductase [Halogeometricum pallidum JCM 14848]|uniref:Phosphoglycerate dehydrogenase-like oxidoreductase n=1 Tax=Halogeometricum pallidum JCM 14848 TaxID=1227487 RepID=M0DI26_HALPD|nr:D-2-hydroxyacid dehydrogenase [Halogeometricum pallidum]ELZ35100.1 phosphoglycerate dehydrogenase-like oxidoreductase [Halogeometricum pallidum JCM 14848]
MSQEDAPDIAVLRQKIHGLSAEEYAETLRERLPEKDIALARTPAEERELLKQVPVATGFSVEEDVLDEAENLELFACVFAGTGHLPLEALEERGVAVTNASGVHGPNIAEQVLGGILSFSRRFHVGWRQKQRNEWRSYPTYELQGSTVTVLGLGAIGEAVVERLEPFGVDTIGVRYSPEKGGPTDEVVGFEDESGFHDALARSDYVVVACPLTDTTRGILDADAFKTMDPETVLINVGRGPVVDTDALLDALRGNAVRGAALDVTDPEPLPDDHELWGFDNVLITPHNAGHTPKYWERMTDIIEENLERLESGEEELRNQV